MTFNALNNLIISDAHLCALQETKLRELVEGLVEEDEVEEQIITPDEEEDVAVGASTVSEKKTEKQRKREKANKIKVKNLVLFFKVILNILLWKFTW